MKSWLKGAWCFLRRHKVTASGSCPVTGAVLLTCEKCGLDNMPKHNKKMRFN